MVQTANTVFRDFETDGVPASGTHKPKKAAVREWGTDKETRIVALETGQNSLQDSIDGEVTARQSAVATEAAARASADAALGGRIDTAQQTADQALAASTLGVAWKEDVRLATVIHHDRPTALEAGDTVDGVVLAEGDRILVKNQNFPAQNGIYVVNASGGPTRSSDADTGDELVGATVYVREGTVNAGKRFTGVTPAPITIDTTEIQFAETGADGSTLDAAAQKAILENSYLQEIAEFRGWPTVPAFGTAAIREVQPGALSVTRGSAALRVNKVGLLSSVAINDVPHGYDAFTGKYLGWRMEIGRTNALLHSGDFTNAYWTKTRGDLNLSVTSVSPDGTVVPKFEETTDNGPHSIQRGSLSVTNGETICASIFVKPDERYRFTLVFDTGGGFTLPQTVTFNTQSGGISATSMIDAYGMDEWPNGWFRIWAAAAPSADSDLVRVYVAPTEDSGSNSYVGTLGAGYFPWGFQLENGQFPTMYIPTTDAAVNRNTTLLESEEVALAAGTLAAEFTIERFPDFNARVLSYFGGSDNRVQLTVTPEGMVYAGIVLNGTTVTIDGPMITIGETVRAAISWKGGAQNLSVNGTSYPAASPAPDDYQGTGKLTSGVEYTGTAIVPSMHLAGAYLFSTAYQTSDLGALTTFTPSGGGETSNYPASRMYIEVASDPSVDMVLNWHAPANAPAAVEYRAMGSSSWQSAGATVTDYPASSEKIFSARVRNLTSDTVYEWRNAGSGAANIRKFRTTPEYLSRDLRIAFVSDAQDPQSQYTQPDSVFNTINDLIGASEPDVVVVGGDFVADDGVQSTTNTTYWNNLLEAISERFVRADGTMIPVVAMTGNHEVTSDDWYTGAATRAYVDKIFNGLYRTYWSNVGGNGYGYFTIGNELLFICLESNHGTPLVDQIPWLTDLLSARAADYRHVMVASHVPPWPFLNSQWDTPTIANWGSVCEMVRRQVIPAIQDYSNVRFLLTAHQHNILATPLLKIDPNETGTQNRWQADPDGIRAIGTGGWIAQFQLNFETADRVSDIDGSSWVDATLSTLDDLAIGITPISPLNGDGLDPAIKHFWRFDLSATSVTAECVNLNGGVYKSFTESVPGV